MVLPISDTLHKVTEPIEVPMDEPTEAPTEVVVEEAAEPFDEESSGGNLVWLYNLKGRIEDLLRSCFFSDNRIMNPRCWEMLYCR